MVEVDNVVPVTRVDIAKDFKHWIGGLGVSGDVEMVGYFCVTLPAGATVNKITYHMKFKKVESWNIFGWHYVGEDCKEWAGEKQTMTLMRPYPVTKTIIPRTKFHSGKTTSQLEDLLAEPRTSITGERNYVDSIIYKAGFDPTSYQSTVDIWVDIDWTGTGEPEVETRYTYGTPKPEPPPTPSTEELALASMYPLLVIGVVLGIVWLAVTYLEVR